MYRDGLSHGRFLASMPRAGTNFVYALLSAADHLARDGNVKYEYVIERFSARGRWRFERETRLPNNLLHCQRRMLNGEFEKLSDRWFVLSHYPAIRPESLFRPAWMHPIVVVRHPMRAAESLFGFYREAGIVESHEEFVDKGVEQIARFMNYWNVELATRGSDEYLVVHYEDLVRKTKSVLGAICTFWGFSYGAAAIERAVEACRRERMMSKIPEERRKENKRVSRRHVDFEEPVSDRYVEAFEKRLACDWGYDLAHPPGEKST